MNAKKHSTQKRRTLKLNSKLDRGSQQRQDIKGKSNIGAKRVTLLPGFLINGFTSGTAKKTNDHEAQKVKEHLLTENLQSFFEQKGKLRRSQRILQKTNDETTTTTSKSPSNNIYDYIDQPPLSSASPNLYPSSISFKSILKKHSKSIFKEISDKFSRVHRQTTTQESNSIRLPVPNQIISHSNGEPNHLAECNRTCSDTFPPPQAQNTQNNLVYSQSVCESFNRKICVKFKKNPVQECQRNIKTEINNVNLVLQGKVARKSAVSSNAEDSDSETKDIDNMLPIPATNWIYFTPKSQKIGVPQQLDNCQLQHGMICSNNNIRSLYKIKPNYKVHFSKLDHNENVPIDNMFLKKVAAIKETPANFGTKWTTACEDVETHSHLAVHDYVQVENGFQGTWADHPDYALEVGFGSQQRLFVPPKSNISHPLKKGPILETSLENNLPNQPVTETLDFTFIEEGNNFKIQESQPSQGTKRQSCDRKTYNVKRGNFHLELGDCERAKMFNFNSQERNIFDFNSIM